MKGLAARHLDLAIVAAAACEFDLTPVPVPSTTVNVWKVGSMSALTKVAVVYYSSTGTTVFELTSSVLSPGRRTPMPTSGCSRARSLRPRRPSPRTRAGPITVPPPGRSPRHTRGHPVGRRIVFGTPIRSGNVSSQLKQLVDTLGGLWAQGLLADKAPSGFTATATAHGEQEATPLAGYSSFHHSVESSLLRRHRRIRLVDGNPYRTSHNGQSTIRSATQPARPRRIKASESLRSLPPSNPVPPLDLLILPRRSRRPGVSRSSEDVPCRLVGQPTSTTSRRQRSP
jgi:NAD(P)H dehydrogenase (quinone)